MTNIKLPLLDPRVPVWESSSLIDRRCPTCGWNIVRESWIRPDGLNVVECHHCGTFYISPAPNEKCLNLFYDQYHQNYFGSSLQSKVCIKSQIKQPLFFLKEQKLSDLRLIRISQYLLLDNKKVLDVGCGRGKLMGLMMSMGADVSGVDPDQGAVDYLKKIGFINVWKGHVESIDPTHQFDLITVSDVIEHPLNPSLLLAECFRRLKPGGFLMIWTPNADHARKDPKKVMFRIHLEHMQYFSAANIQMLCTKNHLNVLHTEVHGHPYFGTINQLRDKPQIYQKIGIWIFFCLNLLVVRWPKIFENRFLRRLRGTYSLLCIMQRDY